MLLLGVVKAFDRVPRVHLWATMRKCSVPEKMILVLQGLCTNMTTGMIVDGVVKGLDMPQGTGKGSMLGPRLFAFFMLAMLDLLHDRLTETNATSGLSCALDDKMTGRPIGTKGEWTDAYIFGFADDTALVFDSRESLQRTTDQLIQIFESLDLLWGCTPNRRVTRNPRLRLRTSRL